MLCIAERLGFSISIRLLPAVSGEQRLLLKMSFSAGTLYILVHISISFGCVLYTGTCPRRLSVADGLSFLFLYESFALATQR